MQDQRYQATHQVKVDEDFYWLRDLIDDIGATLNQRNQAENPCESAFYQSPQSRDREDSPPNNSNKRLLSGLKETPVKDQSNLQNYKFQGKFPRKKFSQKYRHDPYINGQTKRKQTSFKKEYKFGQKRVEQKRFCSCLLEACICELVKINEKYYVPKQVATNMQLNPQQGMEIEKYQNFDNQKSFEEDSETNTFKGQSEPVYESIPIQDIEEEQTVGLFHQDTQRQQVSRINKIGSVKRLPFNYQRTIQFKKVCPNQDHDSRFPKIHSEKYIELAQNQESSVKKTWQNQYTYVHQQDHRYGTRNDNRYDHHYKRYNNTQNRNCFSKKPAKVFFYKEQFKLYGVNVQLKFGSFNALNKKDVLIVPFHSLTLEQNPAKYVANKLEFNIYQVLRNLQKTSEMSVGRVWPSQACGLKGYSAVYWLQAPISYEQEEAFCEITLKKGIERVFNLILQQHVEYVVFPSFCSWPMIQSKKAHSIVLREIMRNISNNNRHLKLRQITIILHQETQYKQLVGCWRQVIDEKFSHNLGCQFARKY